MPQLKSDERVISLSLSDLAFRLCISLSYRESQSLLNRILHRGIDEEIKVKTLYDQITKGGKAISQAMDDKTAEILESNGFDAQTAHKEPETLLSPAIAAPEIIQFPQETVKNTIEQYNRQRVEGEHKITENHQTIELPQATCYIAIDDIGVKKQKEERQPDVQKKGKYVENTVMRIQYNGLFYTLAGTGIDRIFRTLLAFLLCNDLLIGKNLVFLTDGAKDIKSRIDDIFSFRAYTIILDWYHLKKKCQEKLSLGIKGKTTRNQVLAELLRILWVGKTAEAIGYLNNLSAEKIKASTGIEELKTYLENNKPYIPCYAIRANLGMKNSSNAVEKTNDLVVAKRQKHNGMSWSTRGSNALTNIRALYMNHEENNWLQGRQLKFELTNNGQEDFCA